MLKSKLDNGSPCFVLLFISTMSLSLSVIRVQPLQEGIETGGLLSHEVHCRDPHFDTPIPNFLFKQSVCCTMIQRLVSGCAQSSLSLSLLFLSVENSLYSAGRAQIGRQLPTSSTFPSFVNHFYTYFLHVSGVQSSCFITSLKICHIISFAVSSHVFMSSAQIPLLSLALPFLRPSMAVCTSSCVNSGVSFFTFLFPSL